MRQDAKTYPLNAWYAAAWSKEVRPSLLARTICDQPVVLYRLSDGSVSALQDACWHRLLPLSHGRLKGDNLVCGYHGLTFSADGALVSMPDGEAPPARACVRRYPCVERHSMVWIWPGEPSRADERRIPDFHWADHPGWVTDGSLLEMNCDYRLVVDNLMDLTHETYVHASSIGDDSVVQSPFTVETADGFVKLSRWMIGAEAPPFLDRQLRLAHGLETSPRVDRWQLIRFEAPSTIVIDVGVAQTGSGAPQGDRSKGITGAVLNTITPGRGDQCHYFFSYARDFLLHDEALTKQLKDAQVGIFLEDKTILEAQQQSMDLYPDRHLVDLKIDGGSLRARRQIAAMIKSESAGDMERAI